MTRRLPAEWEAQSGVLLAWPHADSDWAELMHLVEPCVVEIATQISRFEPVLIVADKAERVRARLMVAGAEMERVRIAELPTNDTWARDFGPITVLADDGPLLLDFTFNGWGMKFAADRDNQVTRSLHAQGLLGEHALETLDMVLEGGSIESDGAGTILTTTACLLSPNRNPELSQADIEAALKEHLGAERVLWLGHGGLAGDDTDSHIDILARFVSEDTIVYMHRHDTDDEHYADLAAMREQLAGFTTAEGRPYKLVALPWPKAKQNRFGDLVAPSYANFLIINGAVLVPVYG
ncbi:MAG TPA: agmatine deiminase family protein, partial [Mariprofundaceae bacterium]|nr:agmatine deiminase family protein [Mariprofundaceae bacterium]